MPQEILERVPELYGQEEISADKEVFGPMSFSFAWTGPVSYSMTLKTHNAFGLVVGDYPEWGYFNVDELKLLGAQRLVLRISQDF